MMNSLDFDKAPEIISWLIAVLVIVVGLNYIRKIIGFLLMKCYEYFIQN